MDALILSCGTGGGHDAAGRAVMEELQRRGHSAVMLNPYTLRSHRLANTIDSTYLSTAKSAPRVFGFIYGLANLYRRLPWRSPVYFINKGMNTPMEEYLQHHPCDVVIIPHFFAAEILTNMKSHGISVPKMLFIATDYVCTPFTEETDCDAYVIPSDRLREDFTKRGIPAERLHALGIPTSHVFSDGLTQRQARQQLGLDPNKKYILISGGSMGGGKIGSAVKALQKELSAAEDIALIVICGSNATLYAALSAAADPNTIILAKTDQMALYLKAADLFITKPGGLSSTEAAVAEIPIVHTCPIPGCETYNARFFNHLGMSVTRTPGQLKLQQLRQLMEDRSMQLAQRRNVPKDSAGKICDLAEAMAKAPIG